MILVYPYLYVEYKHKPKPFLETPCWFFSQTQISVVFFENEYVHETVPHFLVWVDMLYKTCSQKLSGLSVPTEQVLRVRDKAYLDG